MQLCQLIREQVPHLGHLPNPEGVLRHLLASLLHLEQSQILAWPDRSLAPEEVQRVRSSVALLAQGMPLGYVLGSIDFLGNRFKVDARALCPRPETEELCGRILALWDAARPPETIIDLGTGSGILGLTLASRFPAAEVELVDCDPDALELARENARALQLAHRTTLTLSDWWDRIAKDRSFDLIVSNPPYVATGDPMEAGVIRYEPRHACVSGPEGSEAILRILEQIPERMSSNALAAFELCPTVVDRCVAELDRRPQNRQLTVWRERDLGDQIRFLFCRKGTPCPD